jgi:hypothetical protein
MLDTAKPAPTAVGTPIGRPNVATAVISRCTSVSTNNAMTASNGSAATVGCRSTKLPERPVADTSPVCAVRPRSVMPIRRPHGLGPSTYPGSISWPSVAIGRRQKRMVQAVGEHLALAHEHLNLGAETSSNETRTDPAASSLVPNHVHRVWLLVRSIRPCTSVPPLTRMRIPSTRPQTHPPAPMAHVAVATVARICARARRVCPV